MLYPWNKDILIGGRKRPHICFFLQGEGLEKAVDCRRRKDIFETETPVYKILKEAGNVIQPKAGPLRERPKRRLGR